MNEDAQENAAPKEVEKVVVPLEDLKRLEQQDMPKQVRAILDEHDSMKEAAYAVIDLLHEDPRDMQAWSVPQQNVYLLALAGSVANEDALIQSAESDGPWMTHVYNALSQVGAVDAIAIFDKIKRILPGDAFPADATQGRQIFAKLTPEQQGELMSLEFAFQDYVLDRLPLDIATYVRATLDQWR